MLNVSYRQGDITTFPADALITTINSRGIWCGGVDKAIQRVAGNQYHDWAESIRNARGFGNIETIVVPYRSIHKGKFSDVIFVVDDLQSPLSEIIIEGLKAARAQGYRKVSLPMMRTGIMAGKVEPDTAAVIDQMRLAFSQFSEEVDYLEVIVVVYNDPATYDLIIEKCLP